MMRTSASEHGRAGVQPGRRAVAEVGQPGNPHLAGDLRARQPQIADLMARQALELGLELSPALPDHEAQRRNGVRGGRNGDHVLARQLDLVARLDRQQCAGQPAAVHPAQQPQHARRSARRPPRADRSSAAPSSSSAAAPRRPASAIRWSRCVCETNQVGVPMNDHGCAPRSKPIFSSGIAPVGLHRRAGIALDREVFVDERFDGAVVDHG